MMHEQLNIIHPSFNSNSFGVILGPPWSMKCNIFSYGILLLKLITKRVYAETPMPMWMKDEIPYYYDKKLVVNDSFLIVKYTTLGTTNLTTNCLKVYLDEQLTIGDIVKELKDLVQHHGQPNK